MNSNLGRPPPLSFFGFLDWEPILTWVRIYLVMFSTLQWNLGAAELRFCHDCPCPF